MKSLGIYKAVVVCSLLGTVTSIRFRCHKDICNSTWQYCNDNEERCNPCTPEQCRSEVAESIFGQCAEKCRQFQTSTSTVATTSSTQTVTSALTSSVIGISSPWLLVMNTIAVLLLAIVICVVCFIMNKKINHIKNRVDIERGSSGSLTHVVEAEGEVEKRPLLDSGRPSDSSQHHNTVEDIRALAQATGQGPVQVEQASAPPSYSTNVTNGPTLAKQPSSDVDDQQSMKLGHTELLTDEFKYEAECVTRPKQCA